MTIPLGFANPFPARTWADGVARLIDEEEGAVRYAAKADDNQAAIVAALRGVGASVQHLHRVGHGCPDLLAGYCGQNFLLEVKDGAKTASRQALTDDEKDWHANWQGRVVLVRDADEALRAIGAIE